MKVEIEQGGDCVVLIPENGGDAFDLGRIYSAFGSEAVVYYTDPRGIESMRVPATAAVKALERKMVESLVDYAQERSRNES